MLVGRQTGAANFSPPRRGQCQSTYSLPAASLAPSAKALPPRPSAASSRAATSPSPSRSSTPTSTSTPARCRPISTARSSSPATAPRPTSTSATTSASSMRDLTRASSLTMGQVYNAVIQKERRGDFLGGTIQAVPHLTQEIKARIRGIGRITGAQAVIIEVGGTVGDIEGQVFLEAIRQMRRRAAEDTLLDPRDLPALHHRHGRAQDEADAALRPGAAAHGHPAGRHPLSQRPAGDARDARQDRPVLRRRAPRRGPRAHRAQHLRSAGAA